MTTICWMVIVGIQSLHFSEVKTFNCLTTAFSPTFNTSVSLTRHFSVCFDLFVLSRFITRDKYSMFITLKLKKKNQCLAQFKNVRRCLDVLSSASMKLTIDLFTYISFHSKYIYSHLPYRIKWFFGAKVSHHFEMLSLSLPLPLTTSPFLLHTVFSLYSFWCPIWLNGVEKAINECR